MATPHSDDDQTLYLFTSLTAGSSHIISATSRLETILKANRIPFKAIDIATDEVARRIWSRKAGKRKLPGLVKEGDILGVSLGPYKKLSVQDFPTVEEWNEYGELKMNLGIEGPALQQFTGLPVTGASKPVPSKLQTAAAVPQTKSGPVGGVPTPFTLAMNQKPLPDTPIEKLEKSLGKSTASKEDETKIPKPELEAKTVAGEPSQKLADAIPSTSPETAAKSADQDTAQPTELSHTESTAEPNEKPAEKVAAKTEKSTAGTASKVSAPEGSAVGATSKETETAAESHRGSMISVASPSEMKAVEDESAIAEVDEDARPFEPRPSQHRGSSVSIASEEEIKKVESELMIAEAVEEDEEEDDTDDEDEENKGEEAEKDEVGTVKSKKAAQTEGPVKGKDPAKGEILAAKESTEQDTSDGKSPGEGKIPEGKSSTKVEPKTEATTETPAKIKSIPESAVEAASSDKKDENTLSSTTVPENGKKAASSKDRETATVKAAPEKAA